MTEFAFGGTASSESAVLVRSKTDKAVLKFKDTPCDKVVTPVSGTTSMAFFRQIT
jgi:hypothetical protein